MFGSSCKGYGLLVLRVVVGASFLAHGLQKIFSMGVSNFAGMVGNLPLFGLAPTFFAWIVALVETLGGLMLILGLVTPIAAVLTGFVMLVAILFVHLPNGFWASNSGVEMPLLFLAGVLTLLAEGAGKWSLDSMVFGRE